MYHKIHHLECIIQWFFSIFTRLCNHHYYLITEHFHHPKKKPVPFSSHCLFSPPLQPLVSANLLSVSMNLLFLDISYKWNHAICGLLCLAYFT